MGIGNYFLTNAETVYIYNDQVFGEWDEVRQEYSEIEHRDDYQFFYQDLMEALRGLLPASYQNYARLLTLPEVSAALKDPALVAELRALDVESAARREWLLCGVDYRVGRGLLCPQCRNPVRPRDNCGWSASIGKIPPSYGSTEGVRQACCRRVRAVSANQRLHQWTIRIASPRCGFE